MIIGHCLQLICKCKLIGLLVQKSIALTVKGLLRLLHLNILYEKQHCGQILLEQEVCVINMNNKDFNSNI